MAEYLYDTSAISKHYHTEPGTDRVDALLATVGAGHSVSRLATVEFHSVYAKKMRMRLLNRAEFEKSTREFRKDLRAKRFRVVSVKVAHYEAAARLIRRLGPVSNLRTLDALQLAVALSLHDPARPATFVCADQALCATAAAEGLTVVNPELP